MSANPLDRNSTFLCDAQTREETVVDRKALIREYKNAPRPMGVFRIHNRQDGKALIGVSRDVPAALNRHRAQLRMGGHPQKQLQSDWDALGPDQFAFETLDLLEPPKDLAEYDATDDLRELELLWLAKLAPDGDPGYRTPPGRVL